MENMTDKRAELLQMEEESRALEERDAQAVAIAREKRLAKKKKARRKKIIIVLVILLLIVAAVMAWLIRKKQQEAAANATVEVVAEEGQEIIYAQIELINGNEMTYTVLKEMGDMDEGGMPSRPGEKNGERMPSGEMPEGERPEGERPQMPEDMSNGERPQMSDGMSEGGISQMSENMVMTDSGMYLLTEETKTVLIPVGTDVTTKLGTITTFSRLGAEDVIALVMDGDEIVRIYIVG